MSPPSDTLLAYQPIYNAHLHVQGGELLYRSDNGLSALDIGDQQATSELIFNLCTGLSEQFEGFKHPLFINVSAEFILSDVFLPLDPSRVIVELVERLEPDPQLIAAIERWYKKGFRCALDDFAYSSAWEPLLKFCDIIKIDIQSTEQTAVRALKKSLRHRKIKWLAERVETQAQFEAYQEMGFDLFQGYFFARPQIISGQKIPPAAANLGRLIELLFDDDVDVARLTDVISNEAALSVKLLKIANSPFYRGQGEITSIQQALMRLGLEQLRKWVILIASLEGQSNAAVHLILIRAHACSEIAKQHMPGSVDPGKAFLAALLSGVDILLNVDKREFIAGLKLPADIQSAALEYRGPTGAIVKMIVSVEKAIFATEEYQPVSAKVFKIYIQQTLRTQQILENL